MTRTERRKQWENRVAAFKESDQNLSKWCKDHEISYHQLRYWLKKFDSETSVTTGTRSQWMTIEVDESYGFNNSLHIKVGQAMIEVHPGFDPSLLADVIRTLKTC